MTKTGWDMTDDLAESLRNSFPEVPIRDWGVIARRVIELMPKPSPTRKDVPSVEEIKRRMRDLICGGDIYDKCSSVAHAMMLELAPRQKMRIEAWQWKPDNDSPGIYIECRSQAERGDIYELLFDTTPVPVVDPDAGAKAAYMEYCTASDHFPTEWRDIPEKYRNGWRAVAAAKKVV